MIKLIFHCNECDYDWERDDLTTEDYEEMNEIVYEDDVGCPFCRGKKEGFTPYLKLILGGENEHITENTK